MITTAQTKDPAKLLRCINEQLCIANGGTAGAETIITNGSASPIPAGARSITIKQTGAGTVTAVELAQTIVEIGEFMAFSGPNGKTLPEITITTTGGATYDWTAFT